jgi:protein ImuB
MEKRFVSLWFRHLATDGFALRQSAEAQRSGKTKTDLKKVPFVLRTSIHGRMIVTAANAAAEAQGISVGMVLADARALLHDLEVQDDQPELVAQLLRRLAEWCIRFTPVVALDPPDSLLLDVSGCSHLWGGDEPYLKEIERRLRARGYDVNTAIADTAGTAWGAARYGEVTLIKPNQHINALLPLPPEALRIEPEVAERLHKLGLHRIRQFIHLPRPSLRRRFGSRFLVQLDKATGQACELLEPVQPPEPYQERLPCLEPIITAGGIAIALRELLVQLCLRLQQEQKGLRAAVFKGYRVDGKVEHVMIGTNCPSHHVDHLFHLFDLKIPTIEPALGIELFVLEALKVEDHAAQQETMWEGSGGLGDPRLSELLDRLAGKAGAQAIRRYLPDEHYWPERSFKPATALLEKTTAPWRSDKLRPVLLLRRPERIEVTSLIPDYPPMLFRHHGMLHKIVAADGPERIELEWWLQQGQHRDYYRVEDEDGRRYWLFRLGHYDETYQWFLHGFFA